MAEEKTVDPNEGKSTPDPVIPPTDDKPVVPPDNTPEKFKGKTAEEILTAYTESEKELGRLKKEIGDRPTKEDFDKFKTSVEQWEALGEIIRGNPALLKAIEEEVKGKTVPQDPDKKDDVRESIITRTVGEFEVRLGLDKLSKEDRQALNVKIGEELKELYDPEGKKTVQEVIQSIPLDKLPKVLDKAYKLATSDDDKEKSRLQGMLEARQNGEGAFGSMPSGSARNDGELSPEQREVAKKLGVSEENYLKQLKKDQAN